jgi:hypothetical protein
LERAFAQMDAHPGLHHIAIAAVDSLCKPTQLSRAAAEGRLYQVGRGEDLVAGEAAACVALRRHHASAMPKGPSSRGNFRWPMRQAVGTVRLALMDPPN